MTARTCTMSRTDPGCTRLNDTGRRDSICNAPVSRTIGSCRTASRALGYQQLLRYLDGDWTGDQFAPESPDT